MTKLLSRARPVAGLLLAGQGLLVVLGVLDHEAPLWLGLATLIAGVALVAGPALFLSFRSTARRIALAGRGVPGSKVPPLETRLSPRVAATRGRRLAIGGLGAACVVGVLGYALAARSSLAAPEWAILAYGAALLAAAAFLDRRLAGVPVTTLAGWSLPLVLAPLGLWAVQALLEGHADAGPMRWYVRALLVRPMASALAVFGLDVAVLDETVRIATPQGALFLTVGAVCSGLYATVVFCGVFGLHAWERGTKPARLAVLLAVGIAGLHVANVVRVVALGLVGWAWGGAALQGFHRHLGWVLFLVWSVLFWAVVLRRFEAPSARDAPGS
ncbi:MAG TPA: exosortase/archaeosortase family protein [Candidatus Thermoplasmatota archaeon]|nr:exosortase/archaeosortase family protein [Candidatus Thermoplasmatota archaeon]